MNRKEREELIGIERSVVPRPFNLVPVVAIFMMLIAVFVVVWSAGADDIARLFGVDSVLRVPGDYATIQGAIDAAEAGEIIQIDAGVYTENLALNKPVTLVATSFDAINPANNTTIIDGGGGAAAILIPSGLVQMPVIRGFVIRNSADGIHASSPFIAESNLLHSAGTLVSYQQGGGGFNRNNIYFKAANNAIRVDNSDRPVLIENNRILYSGETGIEIGLQTTTAASTTVEIGIWNNMILGNSEDGIQLVDYPGEPQNTNRRIVIAGNLIANNQRAGLGLMPDGITLEDYSGAGTAEAVRAFNNTFYGNEYGISGGDNLVAFNNIIANSLNRGVWRLQGPPGSNAVIAYTLFSNNTTDAEESNLGTGVLLGVDPLFEAPPNPGPDGAWSTLDDDFSGLVLRSGSPAIDQGVAQYQASDGELVPPSPLSGFTGAAPDLGWREVGAPIVMTPTITPLSTSTQLPTVTVAAPSALPTQTVVPASPTLLPASPTPETMTPLPTTTSAPASPTLAGPSPSPAASTATPVAELIIESVSPDSAPANTTVTMTLSGAGFQPGAIVAFEGGQGLPQLVLGVQVVDPATIVVTLNTQNDAASGPQVWDVRVTNPDGSTVVLEDAFTVQAPQ